jgi:hypothetical protein
MTLWDWGGVFGGASAALQIAGYVQYFRFVSSGQAEPNMTSWSLWSLSAGMSLLIYHDVTDDWAKLALPLACGLSSVCVVVLCLMKRAYRMPDRMEWLLALLDLAVITIWIAVEETLIAYTALLIDTAVSFIPLARSVWSGAEREAPGPWGIWSLAYFCMLVATVLRWEGVAALALPFVYILTHGMIWWFAYRRRSVGIKAEFPTNSGEPNPSIGSQG